MPATYAATSARSISPVRGSGSARALTMTSWSAFATRTRSTASSSSALRRSTVLRSATSTMRARLPSSPDTSPTTRTRSPTTTPLRPSGRAFIAVTALPVDEQAEPTPVDREDQAVACVVVRRPLLGARPGAPPGAVVVLLVLLAVATLARTHEAVTAARPRVGEAGVGLGGGGDVLDEDVVDGRADHDAGVGHPVVGVGVEQPAVQGRRPERQAVLGLGHVGAEAAELAGQRGEPVGLVAADVRDAAQHGRRLGQRAQRGHHGGQLADVVEVGVDARPGAGDR